MEESFELQSSMSPKVKHCQKHYRKGTTVLSLNKSLRRLSIYDKSIHTIKNDELVITEITNSTASTKSSTKLSNESSSSLCKHMLDPIIIHDSDSDSDELVPVQFPTSAVKFSLLSVDKVENIKRWIDNVNDQIEVKDDTIFSGYSELSTIRGEENGTNFITEKIGQAVNSTLNGSFSVQFDQLFKQNKNSNEHVRNTSDGLVIDESYIKSDNSFTGVQGTENDKYNIRKASSISESDYISSSDHSNLFLNKSRKYQNNESLNHRGTQKHIKGSVKSVECKSDDSFSISNESLSRRLKNKKNTNSLTDTDSIFNIKSVEYHQSQDNLLKNLENDNGTENINENELASMLDDIYGTKWREKEEHVLPKSEPRKSWPRIQNVHITNSDRKPKLSVLYKNPYLETEKLKSSSLLQTLHKKRFKENLESPIVKHLQNICDSDTESKSSDEAISRVKLNFNESDHDDDIFKTSNNFSNNINEEEKTSKYFITATECSKEKIPDSKSKTEIESDKENLDVEFSFLGQSLEERIRKKMYRIKDVPVAGKNKERRSLKCKTNEKMSDNDFNRILKRVSDKTKKKTANTDKKISTTPISVSSDEEWENELDKIKHENKPVNGKYSFLASLSVNVPILQCHMAARIYRNNFKLHKDQLLLKLFKLYNEQIFDNAIPDNTALEWSDRMRGSAGFCYCKKITRRTGVVERTVRIVLSAKVIDAAYRLRDTLIHEMCHAATWIVNCVSDGHGSYWKSWAHKAMRTFPELPPIKRCHDYVINTKYTYKCTGCGYSIGRHSKSLDIERKRCGYCLGKFEVLLNKVNKKGEAKSVPATPKKGASGFALFVKENYVAYKQENLKHGEVMKLLGQKFQEMKLKPS